MKRKKRYLERKFKKVKTNTVFLELNKYKKDYKKALHIRKSFHKNKI